MYKNCILLQDCLMINSTHEYLKHAIVILLNFLTSSKLCESEYILSFDCLLKCVTLEHIPAISPFVLMTLYNNLDRVFF